MPKWVPTGAEVAREALILLGGVVIAAAVLQAFPGLKAWVKENWPTA